MEEIRLVPALEVLKHDQPTDCWVVINDEVWDLTNFSGEHPGGISIILKYAGKDATAAFSEVHSLSIIRENLSIDCFQGNLDTTTVNETWKSAQNVPVSRTTTQHSGEKPPLHTLINLYDFDHVAADSAPKKAYAFYSTAATDCWTKEANESMLKRIWFRPRVMRDVTTIDTSSTILGVPVSFPLFICPTGLAKLINPEAEKALARGAASTGILEVVSSSASHPLEDIVQQAPDHPFMFQLYLNKDREKSKVALKKAEALGIKAVFVTVDAAGRGKRESDERLKVDEVIVNPVTGERAASDKTGAGLTRLMGSYIDQGMTWRDLEWIRNVTSLPIILKGIGCAADAMLAMQHNVDGILLSNHGGRNLDFSPPSILLLLEMHRVCPEIFQKMEVYVDGGFRRGGDILKALCLGAKAVGIGRSFLYALHYGTEGVEQLVEILKEEMESAMKLVGIKNLSEVHPDLVNTADVDHLVPASEKHAYITWHPRAHL
ncbi:Cytochrome b5 domain-containing protein 1 [Neopestalotiopsis sp. 37M]|nr:Cytochrome b5 domain-containing protein 1 [Neopestalotiopsis sp. 37M]